jgi:hypothetical protein
MAPHYERSQAPTETAPALSHIGSGPDDDAIDEAAEALRHAEIEAVKPDDDAAPHSGVRSSHEPVRSGAAESPITTEAAALSPSEASISPSELVNMSIDELRGVAAVLDVPDREILIEQDELIEAIRRRLPR